MLKVPTRSNLLPAASPDDIAKVLDAIDRPTPVGKRDYAFILIGATTGLRLADIASLRLKDLDWRNGTIDVVRRKTSVAISVPLVRGIGDALSDYILCGRGTTKCDYVFLVADGSRRVWDVPPKMPSGGRLEGVSRRKVLSLVAPVRR